MVTPTAGSVVLVPFPFSDLSQSKRRPTVVLANVERGDWILCQVTSKPYADARAVELTDADFEHGSLRLVSYARPAKLFTAHESLSFPRPACSLPGRSKESLMKSSLLFNETPLNNCFVSG
ncbi:MAG TPA: hypothetical protein VIT91_14140 [Chthoniobacterales bacterium]